MVENVFKNMNTECEEENVGREKGTEIIFKLKANPTIEKYRVYETYVLSKCLHLR